MIPLLVEAQGNLAALGVPDSARTRMDFERMHKEFKRTMWLFKVGGDLKDGSWNN